MIGNKARTWDCSAARRHIAASRMLHKLGEVLEADVRAAGEILPRTWT